MNKSIVSKEGKKRSGIRIKADSDTASSESIKRLIFSNRFEVGFGITVQYEIGIGNGVIVIKHPGNEKTNEGGLVSFVAYASFADNSKWTILDTEGNSYPAEELEKKIPGVNSEISYDKLNIGNVPAEMDGYRVKCSFSGPGGIAETNYAKITVIYEKPPEPSPVPTPEPTPKHEHEFSTSLSSDAGYHWYGCECGERKDLTEHSFTWTQQTAASLENYGLVKGECGVCGYIQNAEIKLSAEEIERMETEASKGLFAKIISLFRSHFAE